MYVTDVDKGNLYVKSLILLTRIEGLTDSLDTSKAVNRQIQPLKTILM